MEIEMNLFSYYEYCGINPYVLRYEQARTVLAYAWGRLELGLIGESVGDE